VSVDVSARICCDLCNRVLACVDVPETVDMMSDGRAVERTLTRARWYAVRAGYSLLLHPSGRIEARCEPKKRCLEKWRTKKESGQMDQYRESEARAAGWMSRDEIDAMMAAHHREVEELEALLADLRLHVASKRESEGREP